MKLSKAEKKRITERTNYLERVITHLDTLYEQGDECLHPDTGKLVADSEYDAFRNELKKIAPKSPIFSTPTASKVIPKKMVVHNPPMASIAKANGTLEEKKEVLEKYFTHAKENLVDNPSFVLAWKHDGVALSLEYVDGKLVSAGLRPRDGVNGEDVTENAKHIKGIPTQLPLPITCTIRGEVECLKSTFERINAKRKAAGEKTFANPRNFTAGSIQLDDSSEVAKRELNFVGYSILNYEDAPYKTETERAKWCNQTLQVPFVQVKDFSYERLHKMEEFVPELDYEVDGIVISVENLEQSEQLGTHGGSATGNPHGKCAWKLIEENVIVEVKEVEWEVGRSGKVTPVLHFDAVLLAGTMVSKCTAHNLGLVRRKGIGVGSHVRVEKSGKIIPKVIEVVKAVDPTWPDKCPKTGVKFEIVENESNPEMAELMCLGEHDSKVIAGYCHYFQTLGVKGIGDSMVTKLVENEVITKVADFYSLSTKQLYAIGITQRTALLTVARIHMVPQPEKIKENSDLAKLTIDAVQDKKTIPLKLFLAALGINGVGDGTSRGLVENFGDFDTIRSATLEQLLDVDDIGQKTAESLFEYFSANKDELDGLLEHIELELPKQGNFTGKAFVLTGGFPEGKKTLQKLIEDQGGVVKSSVSKTTNYVIVGTDAGAKEKKAHDLVAKGHAIEIIDSQKLKEILNG